MKEKMISKVYEVISNKKLKLWCKVRLYKSKDYIIWNQINDMYFFSHIHGAEYWVGIAYIDFVYYDGYEYHEQPYIDNIIWNPIMLWDLLDYFNSKERDEGWNLSDESVEYLYEIENYILWHYNKKRLCIDEQDDNIIEYVYNLIK